MQTLRVIYEMVQHDLKPSVKNILPNEIISRSHLPWDKIMQHLDELHDESFINMKRSLVVVINITQKGIEQASILQPVKAG